VRKQKEDEKRERHRKAINSMRTNEHEGFVCEYSKNGGDIVPSK
jgi:hypothetical protein